ncbi:MAG: CRTAC1 family protein [Planctomycetota bacterium]|nr:CRTAC1 family protein [Planctomycetota bacterium]
MRVAGILPLVLIIAGCTGDSGAPVPPEKQHHESTPWFRILTTESGFDFTHSIGEERRYWIPEIVAGGVALFDYDNDGDLDIYCVQSAGELAGNRTDTPGNRLFRNEGDLHFTDVTEQANVGDNSYGMGACCCDYDRDGDIDLFVSNVGANVLYRNRGDGTFENVTTSANLGDPGLAASAAFIDLDGDRFPELYVTHYVLWSPEKELKCGSGSGQDYCSPNNYRAPAPDLLYRNRTDGSFENISQQAGIRAAYGNGLGVIGADLDQDGKPDLYVANDGSPNQWWRNLGNLRFAEMAVTSGCAVNLNGISEAGMGVQATDVDEDGDLDLFMTHIRNETNTWYRNDGGVFTDATILTGMAAVSRDSTGFGMGYQDFDHDGVLDLYVANGKVLRVRNLTNGEDPYGEQDHLFRGLGGPRFQELSPRGGLSSAPSYTGRGAAFGDLDGDGDRDLVVINNNGPAMLLVNEAPKKGSSVTLTLVDRDGIFAEGAHLKIHLGERLLHRTATRFYSYCSSNDPRVHVGLGPSDQIDKVEVHWPDGHRSEHGPYAAGSSGRIEQPD